MYILTRLRSTSVTNGEKTITAFPFVFFFLFELSNETYMGLCTKILSSAPTFSTKTREDHYNGVWTSIVQNNNSNLNYYEFSWNEISLNVLIALIVANSQNYFIFL